MKFYNLSSRLLTFCGMVLFSAASAHAQLTTSSSSTSTSSTGSTTLHAPEIDPSMATGMIVLLIGGVLLLTSRHRRGALAQKSDLS